MRVATRRRPGTKSLAHAGMIKADCLRTTDGVRLNLLRAGPAGVANPLNAVVVLIPGWCMPAAIWRETILALAPRHDVLAMDPRGQGDSDIPGHGYHIDQRADDIAQCLEPFASVVLVGWSLGALEA